MLGAKPDWRAQVLVTSARVLAAVAGIPVALGIISEPKYLGFIPHLVLLVGGCLFVGFSRKLGVAARALILAVPLVLIGASAAYHLGPTAGVGLILAMVTILFAVVYGARAGAAALLLTTAVLTVLGYAGRVQSGLYLFIHHHEATYWLRSLVLYLGTTGLMLLIVTRAMRRIEDALADTQEAEAQVRAHDRRLRLTLEAASIITFSCDPATRALAWEAGGVVPGGLSVAALAHTVDEALAFIPGEHRRRVRDALEEALAGRAEYHVEHPVLLKGEPHWVEGRGRLHRGDGAPVLMGTIVDVTERHEQQERRARAQAALLQLSGSEAAGHGDLDAAVREITEVGGALLGVERCGVWRLDEAGGSLVCLDLHIRSGPRHDRAGSLRAESYPGYFAALRTQRTLAAGDARSDERTRELADYLVAEGIVSMLDAPVHIGGRVVGVLCHEHVGDARRSWSADDESFAGSLADCVSRAMEASERVRAYAQLAQVTRRLEAAKEEERRHIARELHDELGQVLTAIKLNLRLVERAATPEARAGRIGEIGALIERSIVSMRELSRAMRPPLLDELGLVPALQLFVEEQGRYSGLDLQLAAPDGERRSPPEIETAAFRIVQEAITNVLRHAQARHVTITLEQRPESIALVIADDGHGFDAGQVLMSREPGGHLGLVGMRERARALGGTFDVSSQTGLGTRVRVELPTGAA